MDSGNKEIWISAYLYYREPFEEFLIEAVYPFVKRSMQTGTVRQFFFIRYWENGPHIRLRLKCAMADRQRLMRDVEIYFHPSPGYSAGPRSRTCVVQFVDYVPEVERYGGPEAIPIAERQFELSSDTVLSLIALKNPWTYQRALGAAIQMHLSFAFACQMHLHECILFFRFVGRASHYIDPEHDTEINRAFEKSFDHEKAQLIPYCRKLWDGLHEKRPFTETWMTDWINGSANVHNHYNLADGNRAVEPPARGARRPKDTRFGIYGSFVHMTNNRLGIRNRDEAYLAYLLVQCLQEMD